MRGCGQTVKNKVKGRGRGRPRHTSRGTEKATIHLNMAFIYAGNDRILP